MNSRAAVICKIYGHTWNSKEIDTYMNMDGMLYPIRQTRRCQRCGKLEKNFPVTNRKKPPSSFRMSA